MAKNLAERYGQKRAYKYRLRTLFIVRNISFQGVKTDVCACNRPSTTEEIFFLFSFSPTHRLHCKLLAAAQTWSVRSATARIRTIKTCSHCTESLKFTVRPLTQTRHTHTHTYTCVYSHTYVCVWTPVYSHDANHTGDH